MIFYFYQFASSNLIICFRITSSNTDYEASVIYWSKLLVLLTCLIQDFWLMIDDRFFDICINKHEHAVWFREIFGRSNGISFKGTSLIYEDLFQIYLVYLLYLMTSNDKCLTESDIFDKAEYFAAALHMIWSILW